MVNENPKTFSGVRWYGGAVWVLGGISALSALVIFAASSVNGRWGEGLGFGLMGVGSAVMLIAGSRFTYTFEDGGLAVKGGFFNGILIPYGAIEVGAKTFSVPGRGKGREFLPLPLEREEFLRALKNYGVLAEVFDEKV